MRAALISIALVAVVAIVGLMFRVSSDQSEVLGILRKQQVPQSVRMTVMSMKSETWWYEKGGVCYSRTTSATQNQDETHEQFCKRFESELADEKAGVVANGGVLKSPPGDK